MKTLALDMGSKRIGLAISDDAGTFAFPSGKLDRKGRKVDLESLATLVEEREVKRIVIGIPLHMNGRPGKGAEACTALIDCHDRRHTLEQHRYTSFPSFSN